MAATTGPTTREPGQPPAARTNGVCTRRHGASSTPPGAQQTQNHGATWRSARQHVDATAAHITQLLSAAAAAGRADGHPHHLLEMWAPSASQPMATPGTTGTLPPHTKGPRYHGTTPVAAHTLRAGFRRGQGLSSVGSQHRSGIEVPPGNVGHQTTSHYLPGAGQTPQHHTGCSRLPG